MLRLRVHTCSGKESIHAQVKGPYILRLRVHTWGPYVYMLSTM